MAIQDHMAVLRNPGGVEFYYPLNQCEMIDTGTSRIAAPIQNVIELTGPLPKAKDKRQEIIDLLAPSFQDGFYGYLSGYLLTLREWAQYENLVDAYKKGTITPELLAILKEEPPPVPQEFQNMDTPTAILTMLRDKKLDFEPFRHKIDIETNWFFFYRVSFHPLPIRRGLEGIAAGVEYQKKEILEHLKTQVSMLMKGDRPGSYEDKPVPPLAPEPLEKFAAAIEKQYQARKRGRTPRDFSARFSQPAAAGLYVNPVTCEITDLRPYQPELYSLLSVKSWDFLAEYAAAIREAVKEELEKKEKPAPPSIFDKAFIRMLNATPANDIININTSLSGRPGKQYGQQNIFTKEWEYKHHKTELFFPIKAADGALLPPLFATSTWKTMHFLSLIFTAHNSNKSGAEIFPVVETSVREYMIATGRPMTTSGIKDTTKSLKKDLALLNEIKLKSNDKKYSLDLVRPFPRVTLEHGKIRVTLEPDFANYLAKRTGLLMNYPASLLKLKENNSNLYPLGYKLALNRSNDANIRTGKANILSIPVLLECCPGIPPIERVRKDGNSPAKRIIEPFEKALDALQAQGILERWEYCLAKGEVLKKPAVTDYNYFVSLYILYEIKDFPIKDELPRLQETAEKRRKRKERRELFYDKAVANQRAKKAAEENGT